MFKKQKNNLFLIIFAITFVLNVAIVHASSFSTNYTLNDEAVDFANNGGALESSTFVLDLSGIPWVDRVAESDSFMVIDLNSNLDVDSAAPIVSPSETAGGNVGGRPSNYVIGDIDDPDLVLVIDDEFDELDLHDVAEEEVPAEDGVWEEGVDEEVGPEDEIEYEITEPEFVEPKPAEAVLTTLQEGLPEMHEVAEDVDLVDVDVKDIQKIPLKQSPMIEAEIGGITVCCWIALILSIVIILHVAYKFIQLWKNDKKRK